jgi:hypothetical protein
MLRAALVGLPNDRKRETPIYTYRTPSSHRRPSNNVIEFVSPQTYKFSNAAVHDAKIFDTAS